MTAGTLNSFEVEQGPLMAALDRVRAALERYVERRPSPDAGQENTGQENTGQENTGQRNVGQGYSLDMLSGAFGLSPFEQSILLLCAGVELDASLAALCTAAQGEHGPAYPTFGLALAALPDAYWSALSPGAALRQWRMVEMHTQPGVPITACALKIDERILHFLVDVQHLDERLVGLVHPASLDEDIVESQLALVDQITAAWNKFRPDLPLLQLCGGDEASRRAIAATACAQRGLRMYVLPAELTPSGGPELDAFVRLWEREAVLSSAALYVDTDAIDASDAKLAGQISRMLQMIRGPVLVGARERWRPLQRAVRVLEVGKPTAEEQHEVWSTLLGEKAIPLNGEVKRLVAQFNLPVASIRASVTQALSADVEDGGLLHALWDASCSQARPRLSTLAQRIEPVAHWDDLVLPTHEKEMLREIATHVRHRATVYGSWGFAGLSSRGLGVSALFSGTSGTGKTMAAEVLANELRLDLFRIDLSGVVSKYIGETEKNLRQVFDAAEEGGTILFFDEADALFGKRSEVKDSHDRYANIEINYLLQRIESYRGLAVLATNMRSALDTAFLRRLRFVVNFPFPDMVQRAEIWRRAFPASMPVGRLEMDKLARLDIAGGNIRNVVLHAAFLAAGDGGQVEMAHLARAARTEFTKIDRPVPEVEISRWA
jgi:hypothetical protein